VRHGVPSSPQVAACGNDTRPLSRRAQAPAPRIAFRGPRGLRSTAGALALRTAVAPAGGADGATASGRFDGAAERRISIVDWRSPARPDSTVGKEEHTNSRASNNMPYAGGLLLAIFACHRQRGFRLPANYRLLSAGMLRYLRPTWRNRDAGILRHKHVVIKPQYSDVTTCILRRGGCTYTYALPLSTAWRYRTTRIAHGALAPLSTSARAEHRTAHYYCRLHACYRQALISRTRLHTAARILLPRFFASGGGDKTIAAVCHRADVGLDGRRGVRSTMRRSAGQCPATSSAALFAVK